MSYTYDQCLDMQEIFDNKIQYKPLKQGALIKGVIINKSSKHILVDCGQQITGIISGKELHDSMNTSRKAQIEDEIYVVVINPENENGNLILSLRKAGHLRAWDRYQEAFEEQSSFTVSPTGANKGGLLVDLDGIKAFIPVSQLSPENYPRVDDVNSGHILEKLTSLIKKPFEVRVIGIDKDQDKMILSEREAFSSKRKQSMKALNVGDTLKGNVTGIVKFGIFVSFNELEGLVHISEIAWGHVKDPGQYAKVGDEIDVKVIGIDNDKISLSMKQLQEDPWIKAAEKYKVDDTIKGIINKVSDFGAFVTIDNDVNGLIHLSEIDHNLVNNPRDFFKEGDEIEAKVIDIDLKDHRIALSTRALKPAPEKKSPKKEAEDTTKKSPKKEAEDTKKKSTENETENEADNSEK